MNGVWLLKFKGWSRVWSKQNRKFAADLAQFTFGTWFPETWALPRLQKFGRPSTHGTSNFVHAFLLFVLVRGAKLLWIQKPRKNTSIHLSVSNSGFDDFTEIAFPLNKRFVTRARRWPPRCQRTNLPICDTLRKQKRQRTYSDTLCLLWTFLFSIVFRNLLRAAHSGVVALWTMKEKIDSFNPASVF